MNQLARDFLVLKTNYTVPDWQTKYNEAIEARKEAEKTVCHFFRGKCKKDGHETGPA